MNFLAHVFLSENFDDEMIGNFIADAVKGKRVYEYNAKIIKGILLHRKIDCFTDSHPVFCKSKRRLQKNHGKFSGVLADVFYDHYLAVSFDSYSDTPLSVFVEKFYHLLNQHHEVLPEKIQIMLPYMVSNNWLLNYKYFSGIQRTVSGLSRRAKFSNNMNNAVIDLKNNYIEYKEEFTEFFSELQTFVQSEKRKSIEL